MIVKIESKEIRENFDTIWNENYDKMRRKLQKPPTGEKTRKILKSHTKEQVEHSIRHSVVDKSKYSYDNKYWYFNIIEKNNAKKEKMIDSALLRQIRINEDDIEGSIVEGIKSNIRAGAMMVAYNF